jgi:hypothetical protein
MEYSGQMLQQFGEAIHNAGLSLGLIAFDSGDIREAVFYRPGAGLRAVSFRRR